MAGLQRLVAYERVSTARQGASGLGQGTWRLTGDDDSQRDYASPPCFTHVKRWAIETPAPANRKIRGELLGSPNRWVIEHD